MNPLHSVKNRELWSSNLLDFLASLQEVGACVGIVRIALDFKGHSLGGSTIASL